MKRFNRNEKLSTKFEHTKIMDSKVLSHTEINVDGIDQYQQVYKEETPIKGKVSDYSIKNLIKLGIKIENLDEARLTPFQKFQLTNSVDEEAKRFLNNLKQRKAMKDLENENKEIIEQPKNE